MSLLLLTLEAHKDGVWVSRLVKELENINKVVKVSTIDDILHEKRIDNSTGLSFLGIHSDCEGIINRVSDAARPDVVKRCIAILNLASRLYKIPIFNGPVSYSLCSNKWCHHAIFAHAGLESPPTAIVIPSCNNSRVEDESVIDTGRRILQEAALPYLLKPNSGGFGAGIVKIDIAADGEPDALRTMRPDDDTCLLQAYVPPAGGNIYRVWFLRGRVQCAVVRTSTEEYEFTNGCSGGTNTCTRSPKTTPLTSAWGVPKPVRDEIEQMLVLLEDAHAGSVEFLEEAQTGQRLYFDLNLLSTLPNVEGVSNADAVWGSNYDPWKELAESVVHAPTDIASLARYILSDDCKSIVFLTGAGVSVASGIPDFRSPGGMYDTLKPELITANENERNLMATDPTNVVTWDMFRKNSFPYLEVRRPFILGSRERRWKTTIAHRFAELLHIHTGKLRRIYTQNIDGLYFQCDAIPSEKIVSIHGTIGRAACEGCGEEADFDWFCDEVQTKIKDIYGQDIVAPAVSSNILCGACQKPLVKPQTVLFGRGLPSEFFERSEEDLPTLDLLIVAGTSLVVSPANGLVSAVPNRTIRAIVNRDPVGAELGIEYGPEKSNRSRDFFAQGDCDDVFLELITNLGWLDFLNIDDLSHDSAQRVEKARRDSAYTKWF